MEKTESERTFRKLAIFVLAIYFPIFTFWTLLGTKWYGEIHKDTPDCIDEDQQWINVFWISVSYFLVFTYVATLLTVLIENVRIFFIILYFLIIT